MDNFSPRAQKSSGAKARSRYRIVDGRPIIELTLKTPHQLFDERDPAPFRERDLDDDAAHYIIGSYESLPDHRGSKLALSFARLGEFENSPQTIKHAIHNHFAYEAEIKNRELHTTFKQGYISLLIGLTFLLVVTYVSEAWSHQGNDFWMSFVREGLMVMGWVSMWHPINIFLYEWWPIRSKEKTLLALSEIEIEILPVEEVFVRPPATAGAAGAISKATAARLLERAAITS